MSGSKGYPQMNAERQTMDSDDPGTNAITKVIIGCAFKVMNTLGHGFLEKVYENALARELQNRGLSVTQQRGFTVIYDGIPVGQYVVDLLVEDSVIIELKTVEALTKAHIGQCLNYLRTTGIKLCLLMNFGQPRVEIRRIING